MNIQELDQQIRQRYGTPHQFCKLTGLPRATVYQLLAGRYPGNRERQAARVEAVLNGTATAHPLLVNLDSIGDALTGTACNLCLRRGRCTRRRARRCAEVHAAQARAVLALIEETVRIAS